MTKRPLILLPLLLAACTFNHATVSPSNPATFPTTATLAYINPLPGGENAIIEKINLRLKAFPDPWPQCTIEPAGKKLLLHTPLSPAYIAAYDAWESALLALDLSHPSSPSQHRPLTFKSLRRLLVASTPGAIPAGPRPDWPELTRTYPAQKTELRRIASAWSALCAAGPFVDISTFECTSADIPQLAFHILPTPSDLSPDERRDAIQFLRTRGPAVPFIAGSHKLRWFPIDPAFRSAFLTNATNPPNPAYILHSIENDDDYILAFNDPDHLLIQYDPSRATWNVQSLIPPNPANGEVSLTLRFDPAGASQIFALTSANKGKPLAILLANHIVAASTVMSAISDSCQITFGTPTPARPLATLCIEVETLKQKFDRAALPFVPLLRLR